MTTRAPDDAALSLQADSASHDLCTGHDRGDNCIRFEVRKGLEQPGAPAPPYVCVANFWVKSGEEFGAALAQHGKEIYGEIPKFTNLEPVRAWEEVIIATEPSSARDQSSSDGERR